MRAAALILLAVPLLAQEPHKDPFRALADSATAAPPELAADILIRLAESARVKDKAAKIEWLETAFALAPSAKFKWKQVASPNAPAYLFAETDAGSTLDALADGFDTLSLQSRAVQAMVPLDREKALQLFRAIPPLQVPPLTCADALGYSVDAYYDAARTVYEHAADREALETLAASMRSPFELSPMARLIFRLRPDSDTLDRVRIAYAGSLRGMHADDRSFTLATNASLFTTIRSLAAMSFSPPGHLLVASTRVYLVNHLRAARCADSVDPDGIGGATDAYIDHFNNVFRAGFAGPSMVALASGIVLAAPARASASDIPPISDDERKATSADGTVDLYSYWQTPQTEKLKSDLDRLRYGTDAQQAENDAKPPRDDGHPQFLTDQQRGELAWEASLHEFRTAFDHWRSDHDEPDLSSFHMAARIYRELLDLIPNRTLRAEVAREYVAFLKQSPIARENPPEWLLEVKSLLHGGAAAENEIRASGDLAMSLYLALSVL